MEIKSSIHNYTYEFDSIDNLTIELGDYIIIDDNLHVPSIHKSVANTPIYYVKANEYSKEYANITPIIDDIIKSGFRKNNRIIAIGGGVVQDITGFISSILYRGVKWVFYPTTLLSQGDSCIGGKTSINFKDLKNQLGNFYPPTKIVIDTNFLKTLPKIQIDSGIGEMSHYFFIDGLESFNFYKNYNLSFGLKDLIKKSLNIKKTMVELDEFDNGPRKVFNYGHTFGHSIESVTNYNVPHGIAVSYGMDIANFFSLKKGYISLKEYVEMKNVLNKIILNNKLPNIDINMMVKSLSKDKKNIGENIGLILTKGVGNMFLEQNNISFVRKYLKEYFNG
jgi:3-dehydroquinate synthase